MRQGFRVRVHRVFFAIDAPYLQDLGSHLLRHAEEWSSDQDARPRRRLDRKGSAQRRRPRSVGTSRRTSRGPRASCIERGTRATGLVPHLTAEPRPRARAGRGASDSQSLPRPAERAKFKSSGRRGAERRAASSSSATHNTNLTNPSANVVESADTARPERRRSRRGERWRCPQREERARHRRVPPIQGPPMGASSRMSSYWSSTTSASSPSVRGTSDAEREADPPSREPAFHLATGRAAELDGDLLRHAEERLGVAFAAEVQQFVHAVGPSRGEPRHDGGASIDAVGERRPIHEAAVARRRRSLETPRADDDVTLPAAIAGRLVLVLYGHGSVYVDARALAATVLLAPGAAPTFSPRATRTAFHSHPLA